MNKIFVINISILLIIFLAIIITLVIYLQIGLGKDPGECIDANSVVNLAYNGCYDATNSQILIIMTRGADGYNINGLTLSYTDDTTHRVTIKNIPKNNEIKRFNFPASINPEKARILVDIETNLNPCANPRNIIITPCTGINSYSNISENSGSVNITNQDSDNLPSLVNNTFITSCISNWNCGGWEECRGEIQKRNCQDSNLCSIQTDTPDFTKYCNGSCIEDWQCQWSACTDGFTTPTCTDRNNCGTNFKKPGKISCREASSCSPNIICGDWSECKLNLDVVDLLNIQNVRGQKSRLCRDSKNCAPPTYEFQECSSSVNIYTKEIEWYGEKYLEVYDKLTDKLLTRVKYSSGNLPSIDLNFYLN